MASGAETTTPADLDVLWQPCEIGPVSVPNRVCVSAHQTQFPIESDDLVGDRYVAYLEERARGGAGMIVVEAGAVHPSTARVGLINAFRPEIVPGFRKLADAVHAHGTKLFAQLSHLGSQDTGTSNIDRWHPLLAPSALPSTVYGRGTQAMDAGEIADVADGYGRTALNAREAGLDGAEISAGHGYLMTQFLSPMTNHRTDDYGGSTENRCRFPIEAAEQVRRRCGADFPLGIRLSFDEFMGPVAITPELSEEIVRVLHATGLFAYFSITGGNYHTMREWVPTTTGGRDGHLAPHAERTRAAVDGEVPVMVASAIRSVERAAEIVAAGQADLVAMTRAHIADPAIVSKARAGRSSEIRPCVGANQGCVRRLFDHNMIACTVNPAAGREATLGSTALRPAPTPRSVLVVGGGPAGMKLAESAAERGHGVTLLERAAELGGALRLAGRLPNRGTWLELADEMAGSLDRLGVDVRLQNAASVETVAELDADAVFLATGAGFDRSGYSISHPQRDSIPGLAEASVLDPAEAIADPEACGQRVAIVDDVGDHLPLGLALLLADRGRAVTVLTRHLFVGSQLVTTADLPWLYPQLTEAGVELVSQVFPERAGSEGITAASVWGGEPREIAADTVILSMMRRSEDSLHAELAAAGILAIRLGDCLAPREVDDAIYEGAMHGSDVDAALVGAAG